MTNIDKNTWANGLKINMSVLNNGFKQMMAQECVEDLRDTSLWAKNVSKEVNTSNTEINSAMKKHFKIEKIASFMTFAFEAVKNKFYSEQDLKRGYMMKFSEDFSEQRCEFVNATTGGITNETKHFSTPEEVIHELKQAYNLAKNKSTSNYLIERPQISAKNSTIQK